MDGISKWKDHFLYIYDVARLRRYQFCKCKYCPHVFAFKNMTLTGAGVFSSHKLKCKKWPREPTG